MSEGWTVIETENAFSCPWFEAGYDLLERPDGSRDRYYWVDRPHDAVGVLAVSGDEVVMIERYRPKLRATFWEYPGGHLQAGESYEDAARRELREETGIVAGSAELLFAYYPTGIERYRRGVVVATDLALDGDGATDGEVQRWELADADEALDRAQVSPGTGWTVTTVLAGRANGVV